MRPREHITVEEYFIMDAQAPEGVRLEYFDGVVYCNGYVYSPELAEMMAGESESHALVKDNVRDALQSRLPERCRAFSASMRVWAPGYGKGDYAYPDVFVTCGPRKLDETENPPTLLNPVLVVEVLSRSTRTHDFVAKERAYFRIDELQEYWIVASEEGFVQQMVRTARGVEHRRLEHLDAVLTSEAFELEIPVAEFYVDVDLPPPRA